MNLPLAIVVARAENGVIGRNGDLPWKMGSDLAWFKKVTMGKPVIMGRRTYESIGKPLPGRDNIVLTRDASFKAEGTIVVHDLKAARQVAEEKARVSGASEICLIGGGTLYAEGLPLTARLYLTIVEAAIEGDTFFPALNEPEWTITQQHRIEPSSKNDFAARVEIWDRR